MKVGDKFIGGSIFAGYFRENCVGLKVRATYPSGCQDPEGNTYPANYIKEGTITRATTERITLDKTWHFLPTNNDRIVEILDLGKKGGATVKNLLERLLDPDTALIREKVMNTDGSLNMSAGQVQEALLQTDGFRTNLLAILKAEKAAEEKKK